jgi:DNA polymerase-3 subunit beta
VLAELTTALPLGTVELRTEKSGGLLVTAGKVKAMVQGMGMAEFPPMEVKGAVRAGTVEVEKLKQVLSRVGFAVSRDESRPVLTGVLWEVKRGLWVATDGYRLSMTSAGIVPDKKGLLADRLLLGERVLTEGVRAFEEVGVSQAELSLHEASKQVVLSSEGIMLVGRVLEGEYPQYGGIIPDTLTIEVGVDRQEFASAVKAAAIFARDSAHIIRLEVKKGMIVVSANTPQVGDNRVEVEAEVSGEGGLTIAFNSKYLSDLLSHMNTERIGMGFTEALKPGVFWETRREEFQHVIMPVRVREGE